MEASESFDLAIEDCLDMIAAGEEPGVCREKYPALWPELEPLVSIACKLQTAYPAEVPDSLRDLGLQKFLQAVKAKKRERPGLQLGWLASLIPRPRVHAVAATAVACLVVLSLLSAGLVYAANGSLPGSPLYSVKRLVENMQLALTPGAYRKAKLYVSLAEKRLSEAKELVSEDEERAALALRQADEASQKAQVLAEQTGQAGAEITDKVDSIQETKELVALSLRSPDAKKLASNQDGEPEPGSTSEDQDQAVAGTSTTTTTLVTTAAKTTTTTEAANANGSSTTTTNPAQPVPTTETSEQRSIAFRPFEVTKIAVSPSAFSPNGDGVKDTTTIQVVLSTDERPSVIDLYLGDRLVQTTAGEFTNYRTYTFRWDGLSDIGRQAPDGNYTIKVRNRYNQTAALTGTVKLDTTPPAPETISPPDNFGVVPASLLFTWKSLPGVKVYALQITSTSYVNLTYDIPNLATIYYELPWEKLFPGEWYWYVFAEDEAGNFGRSPMSRFVVKPASQ